MSNIIYPENTILIQNLEKELSKYKRSEKQIYYEDKYLKTDIVYSGRRLLLLLITLTFMIYYLV